MPKRKSSRRPLATKAKRGRPRTAKVVNGITLPKRKVGRPLGQSKYAYASEADTEYILQCIAKGRDDAKIAQLTGYTPEHVRDIRAEYYPTTSLAKAYLRSHHLTLAKRIVAEADVDQALDVLSRPDGVLESVVKSGAGPRVQVLTSVNPASLGGVTSIVKVDDDGPVQVPVPVPPEHPVEERHARPRPILEAQYAQRQP